MSSYSPPFKMNAHITTFLHANLISYTRTHKQTGSSTHIPIYLYTQKDILICKRIPTHLYTHNYSSVHPYLLICTPIPTHLYTHAYSSVHPYLFIYTPIPTHMYTHTYSSVHPYLLICTHVRICLLALKYIHTIYSCQINHFIDSVKCFLSWCVLLWNLKS